MKRWAYYLIGVAAATSWLGLVTSGARDLHAEVGPDRLASTGTIAAGVPSDYRFRGRSQGFLAVTGGQLISALQGNVKPKPDFSAVITKEPDKYEAETPFRDVAELGGKYYGFALDTAPRKAEDTEKAEKKDSEEGEKKEARDEKAGAGPLDVLAGGLAVSPGEKPAKPLALTRLYFDLNHNGDLTDDGVIEADPAKTVEMARGTAQSQARSVFPTAIVSLDIGGRKVEFPFTMSTSSQNFRHVVVRRVQLSAAAYREGEIVLEGEKRRVVLVDYNSNGRFDDASVVAPHFPADGPVYPQVGDMLFIDPNASASLRASWWRPRTRISFRSAPLIMYGDRLFDVKIDPSGETLSLEPSSLATGYVTNPNRGFRATVYSERGIVEIVDDGTGKAAASRRRMEAPGVHDNGTQAARGGTQDRGEARGAGKGRIRRACGAWQSADASSTGGTRTTMVSAQGTRNQFQAVKVTGGQTAEFPFGPPYTPQVTAAMREGQPNAALSLKLIGTAGEVCSSLVVNGSRVSPSSQSSPRTTRKWRRGKFSYG